MKPLKIRRIVLAITGLVFLLIAIASLAAPSRMAESMGYVLGGVAALNEFRNYLGGTYFS